MSALLVHIPSLGDCAVPAANLQLGAGETARFGRGVDGCPVEIALPDPAVPRLAGEIVATDSYWLLNNLSAELSLLVENPEGAGEHIRVAPRRLAAPIPFEFSRVVLATQSGATSFHVYAPCHSYMTVAEIAGRPGASTVDPFALNERATYFHVLVALCEPRLRDVAGAGIPTTHQITARLRDDPGHASITTSAVNFHIDYLVDHKLRIRTGRQSGRRESLVATALRFGIVQERHLAVLPARTPPSSLLGTRS